MGGRTGGRPRGHRPLIDVVGQRRRVQLIEAEITLALAGDASARKNLFDRMDPALARQELTGAEGKPIALEHAENAAASLNTEILRELDAIATRIETSSAAEKANGRGATQH